MPSDLLTVHVGQCGVQVANSLWELLCLEHSISVDGEQIQEEDDTVNTNIFFQQVNNGKYIPRCIIIDSEAIVIDEIRNGAYRNLYHKEHLINTLEDAANNFARGSFLIGSKIIKPFRQSLRKLTEQVERLGELILVNSMSGGSGGGLGALFLQQMQVDYPKTTRVQFSVFPCPVMATSVVEPYNASFHSHTTMETCELSIFFDNEALYNICKNILGLNSPSFTNINRILSLMISSSSSSMRFANTLTSGIQEMHTNLVPYPRIHQCLMSHAPMSPESSASYNKVTVEQITKSVLSKEYQTLKCDTNREKFISVILNYRGMISPSEMVPTIQKLKATSAIRFVEWCPTGFKIGINSQCPTYVPESNIGFSDKSVTMITNSAAIRFTMENLGRKFDLLFSKRAFVHWFINEGMEETEFGEAEIDLKLLAEDYIEISLSESDLLKKLDTNPGKRSRSFSLRHENENKEEDTDNKEQDNDGK